MCLGNVVCRRAREMSLFLQCWRLVPILFLSPQASSKGQFLESAEVSEWAGQEVELPSH